MSPAGLKALARLKLSEPEARALFALIRAESDEALLARLAKPLPQPSPPASLAEEIKAILAPLMAPLPEKAMLLALSAAQERLMGKSFIAVVRALEGERGADGVRQLARDLMATIAATGDRREKIT